MWGTVRAWCSVWMGGYAQRFGSEAGDHAAAGGDAAGGRGRLVGIRDGCEAGGAAAAGCEAAGVELHAAVGEINDYRCEGGGAGAGTRGEPDAGGESVGAAERGVSEESGGVRAADGDTAARGRGQRDFAFVSERIAAGGVAG